MTPCRWVCPSASVKPTAMPKKRVRSYRLSLLALDEPIQGLPPGIVEDQGRSPFVTGERERLKGPPRIELLCERKLVLEPPKTQGRRLFSCGRNRPDGQLVAAPFSAVEGEVRVLAKRRQLYSEPSATRNAPLSRPEDAGIHDRLAVSPQAKAGSAAGCLRPPPNARNRAEFNSRIPYQTWCQGRDVVSRPEGAWTVLCCRRQLTWPAVRRARRANAGARHRSGERIDPSPGAARSTPPGS